MATPRMFQLAKGKPIIPEPDKATATIVRRQVEEVIRMALRGHEGDRVITSSRELTDENGSHLIRYTDWRVGRDLSVQPTNLDPDMALYDWQDLEITSPALFATEKSFAEVHHVLTAICNNFWVFAPETAGLHIHYGRGKDWIPIHHLRRIAAFLFAADPILTQMHPPHRRGREWRDYCLSNRHYSTLAYGISSAQVGRHLEVGDLDEGHYKEDLVTSRPGSATKPKPEKKKGPKFIPIFKPGTLEGYKFDKDFFNSGRYAWAEEGEFLPGRQVGKSLDIITAVRELLSAPSAPVISTLMQHWRITRCAYNFLAYDVERYGAVQLYGARLRAQPKRTIEFRQATGTVNADEVVAHARIAVRLCEFACETDINALWIMILDFVQAEKHPAWYDVFNLLFELGLVDEARVIQRQIAKQRGIEIINEDLGTFKAPPVPPSRWSRFVSWLSNPLSSQPEPGQRDNPPETNAEISSNIAYRGMARLYR
ncbi:hypothetical protein F5Y00DRAFT_269435 [Daldinia vernicosa]|uniref:uncharacterized protein n=1 Tax=Daldinia vernicosa TaxID=114800 RepID=UPI002007C897|nr:uncharacterized protein F5Y00DRAFT_269435 [Daldinia vernicosa]KAI0849452.1 hypothetical protein F5Y00DRAFT_269435 [Daldinia vernicosa]